ncbi:hypothetical protein [Roseovarius dicentrarchi]|uniref:hypothetical protein n=1 Tax=Roseovarius dicentrarchi TaxID=2250573 RepID=UPI000DEBB010|nr:hypothetical protein [Roseovarius dicentrarchi]
MKIHVTSVDVDNQNEAEKFCRDVHGFKVKNDIPLGEHRWLAVVSSDESDGTDLLLEPRRYEQVEALHSLMTDRGRTGRDHARGPRAIIRR